MICEQVDGEMIVPISAHSPDAMLKMVSAVVETLRRGVYPRRLAYSFQTGRKAYKYRCALVGETVDRLVSSTDYIKTAVSNGSKCSSRVSRSRKLFRIRRYA